jgi:hypothetical protein
MATRIRTNYLCPRLSTFILTILQALPVRLGVHMFNFSMSSLCHPSSQSKRNVFSIPVHYSDGPADQGLEERNRSLWSFGRKPNPRRLRLFSISASKENKEVVIRSSESSRRCLDQASMKIGEVVMTEDAYGHGCCSR